MQYDITLVQESCCVCGVIFGIPEQMLGHRRETGEVFYCPNGHNLSYRESDVNRLKNQLEKSKERLRREEIARESAENKLRATKGVVTKLKNRIANGVCPCCHRSFDNLKRHMETKHPEFTEDVHDK